MRDLARRPEKDRRELFRATAQAMRIHEAIIEEDFWVCWTLGPALATELGYPVTDPLAIEAKFQALVKSISDAGNR